MSRNLLLRLIVITATLLAWFGYQELQRSKALIAQTNELVKLPESRANNTVPLSSDSSLAADTNLPKDATLPTSSSSIADTTTATNTPLLTNSSDDLSTSDLETTAIMNDVSQTQPSPTPTSELQELSVPTLVVNETPATPETTNTPNTACSSFDEAGLVAAFDGALASFLTDANSVYGNQYENLQYELSSKKGIINGEQGTVTTNYSGTVKELSTGQDVSANGTITATFNWDGCAWQVLDYSF